MMLLRKVMADFDSSLDSLVQYENFVKGVTKWIQEAKQTGGYYILNLILQTKKVHDLLGAEEQSDEVVEGVENPGWISFKGVLRLLLGTIISAVHLQTRRSHNFFPQKTFHELKNLLIYHHFQTFQCEIEVSCKVFVHSSNEKSNGGERGHDSTEEARSPVLVFLDWQLKRELLLEFKRLFGHKGIQQGEEAAVKRERAMAYAFSHQASNGEIQA